MSAHTSIDIAKEFAHLKGSQDPEPVVSIEYLFVLSAFSTYLRKAHPKTEDGEDDYQRVNLAIKLAKQITALKANLKVEELDQRTYSQWGPHIIYNGTPEQNQDLKIALENQIDYPKEKFIVLELPKENINTKGQFISIKQALELNNTTVGIITHAYHYPRACRMLNKKCLLYPFGENTNIFAFLVDREFTLPKAEYHIQKELKKIDLYINKGDLAIAPANDIIYLNK